MCGPGSREDRSIPLALPAGGLRRRDVSALGHQRWEVGGLAV